jgi:hypothetical protein
VQNCRQTTRRLLDHKRATCVKRAFDATIIGTNYAEYIGFSPGFVVICM